MATGKTPLDLQFSGFGQDPGRMSTATSTGRPTEQAAGAVPTVSVSVHDGSAENRIVA